MGVLPVAAGNVTLEGKDITKLKPHQRAALGIAYVPQGREIFARLTVEENLLMGMATKSGRKASTIKGEVYELFPVLKEMLHRRGGDLSGGQQQQLAIARALLAEPKLIILDEPTTGVDPLSRGQFWDLINSIIGLSLTYLAFVLPFTIWTLRGFVANVPKELEENYTTARYWNGSPDQGIAGGVMMLEGSLVTLGALAWLFLRWARESEERQQLLDEGVDPRAATRAVRYGREVSGPR